MSLQHGAQVDSSHPLAPFPTRIAGAPTMWGLVDDYPFWNAVIQLYDEDKLEGAFEVANRLGDGREGRGIYFYRLIEAEYALRRNGLVKELAPSLSLEYMPSEQEHRVDWLMGATAHVLDEMRTRLNWTGEEKVWVSVLPEQYDFAFASNRFGYCAQKTDFYKICLPAHAAADPTLFGVTLAHELAHVVSLSLSKQRLTKWLGEGFSVFISGEGDNRSRVAFLNKPQLWLAPRELESQFGPGVDLDSLPKWLAYQQAGWVVRYAAKLQGIPGLMRLLEFHGDESFWHNMKVLALERSRTGDAIQEVYGMSEEELMGKAYESLKA